MILVNAKSTMPPQIASVSFPGVENRSVSNQDLFKKYKSGILQTTRNIMAKASFFGSLMMASSSD